MDLRDMLDKTIGSTMVAALLATALAMPARADDGNRIKRGAPVFAVGKGNGHMLLVKPSGYLWGWGDNTNGELGDGNTHSKPYQSTIVDLVAVGAGSAFSVGVDQNGEVYTWGLNDGCQLGNGTKISTSVPQDIGYQGRVVAAGKSHAAYLTALGEIEVWGSNNAGEAGQAPSANKAPVCTPTEVPYPAANWIDVAAGDSFTVALAADGTIWTWGANNLGQLGRASTAQPWLPAKVASARPWIAIAAGTSHVLAINDKGELWGWGSNDDGQLGVANTTSSFTVPHQITTAVPFKAVAAGNHHTLALMANGTLWAAGDNNSGQLGVGSTPVKFPLTPSGGGTKDWQYLAAGGDSSAAMKADGTFYAFGNNAKSQLGTGDTKSKNAPGTALLADVKPGFATQFAEIRSDGTMYEWKTTGRPQAIPGSMNSLWTDVSYGSNGFFLAVRADGTLWSWGLNDEGELGTGASTVGTPQAAPVQVDPSNTLGGNDRWVAVSAALTSAFGLKGDGTLYAWGENDENGKLGTGDTSPRYSPAQIGSSVRWVAFAADATNGYAISSTGQLYGWGDDTYGRVGDGNYGADVYVTAPKQIGASVAPAWVAIAAGPVALNQDGVAYHWGDVNVTDATAVPGPLSTYCVQVAANLVLQTWGTAWRIPTNASDNTPVDEKVTLGGRGIFNGATIITTRGRVQQLHDGAAPTTINQIY